MLYFFGFFMIFSNKRRTSDGHIMEEPPAADDSCNDAIIMQNGQLMGAPVVFPHLCAINFVAFWTAIEKCISRKVESDIAVAINGDNNFFTRPATMLTAIRGRDLWPA